MINFNNLPKFQSRPINSPNLVGYDVEDNLFPDINFSYYSTSEFQNASNIGQIKSESSFSLLHCNIRSISANHGSLITLLSDLNFEFDVIGISETKIILHKDPIINISIHDYSFISQPTWSNAGGVAFYIKKNISLHTRDDFTVTTNDFELLSVEIHNKDQRNTVCLVIYRHPHSNLENFSDYLIDVIDKISNEQKYCVVKGDFNINLL
jgi:exonuclease III